MESPQLEAMRTLLKATVDDNELVNGGPLVWTKRSPKPTWLQLHTTETATELTSAMAAPTRYRLRTKAVLMQYRYPAPAITSKRPISKDSPP